MSLFDSIFGRKAFVDFNGFVDWHSHILPGVDDGVGNLDDSLAILARYEEMGIREVWLTPHIMEDMPNRTADLRSGFSRLSEAYDGPIVLRLAAENMVDVLFAGRLAAGDVLPIGPRGDMLLVETSCFNPPMKLESTLADIRSAGYFPLIAHPERYVYVESPDGYRRWKELGCCFQLNLLSLTGFYGQHAQKSAEFMLGRGMYDCVGTDIHGRSQLDRLRSIRLSAGLMDHLESLFLNKLY